MIDEQQRTNCEAVNDEPSHWISYSGEASGYHEDLDPRSLMISVVLDAGCQREFSGIRLVILRRDSEGAEATVRDCPELFKFYNGHHTHQRHRDALTSLRTSGELSNSLLRDYARGSQGRKICTVIFELVLVRADGDPTSEQKAYAKLSLLQRQELNPGDHAFHILYDHAQQSNTPLLLFLQCSHTSITKSCLTAIDRWSSTGPRIYVHRVRILPLVSNRPVPVSLPLPLLKRCVSYAFVQRQRGWREGLLSCGLVCRSWAPILDLFFQHFHHPKMLQFRPPDISAVAVSLQRTPFRAALVRGYTPLLYTTPRPETVTKFFESQNSILRQAKSVEELIIGSTHPSLSEELLRILGGLREVRTFKVSRMILPSYRQISKEDIYDLNISEIQSAIALWPHLTTLKITDWKSPITSNTTGPHNPSIQHPALSDSLPMGTEFENAGPLCHIEVLGLTDGKLTGPQLLFFTSPSYPLASLREVRLARIEGPTNSDFLEFLTRAAPTLQRLDIGSCIIPRSFENEEYAIDTVMPKMKSLELLTIIGDLASALALSRKSPPRLPLVNGRKNIHIFLANRMLTDQASIIDALRVTGWSSVHIAWGPGDVPEMVEEAFRIAEARGVEWRLQC